MDNLIKKYSKEPIKADLYTLEQLKIALDDLLIEYCQVLGHKENYFVTDVQNTIGLLSMVLGFIVLWLSYYFEFQDIKEYMKLCIYIYFAINILCYAFSSLKGGKILFDNFIVKTKICKNRMYNVIIDCKNKKIPLKYNKSVFELFDDSSALDHELFFRDLSDMFKDLN